MISQDKKRVAELRGALQRIQQGIPAHSQEHGLFVAHFDGDGNEVGIEPVDPLAVIESIAGVVRAALDEDDKAVLANMVAGCTPSSDGAICPACKGPCEAQTIADDLHRKSIIEECAIAATGAGSSYGKAAAERVRALKNAAPQVQEPRRTGNAAASDETPAVAAPRPEVARSETPVTDDALNRLQLSQSFIDQTRLFDRHYVLPLIEHARQMERDANNALNALADERTRVQYLAGAMDTVAPSAIREPVGSFAPYAVPDTMSPDGHFGLTTAACAGEINTPATRVALKLAKDIYKHANQAGVAPLVFAQEITEAVNESLRLRAARSSVARREGAKP